MVDSAYGRKFKQPALRVVVGTVDPKLKELEHDEFISFHYFQRGPTNPAKNLKKLCKAESIEGNMAACNHVHSLYNYLFSDVF